MTIDYLAAQKYARPVVARILRCSCDVDDVLQDATVKAITRIGQFRGDCQFRTWYCRIAITTALMRLRQRRPCCDLPIDLPSLEPEPDSAAIAVERKERLLTAAAQLPPVLRLEFLAYLDGDDARDAAIQRGVSIDAVKGSRFRIRNKLRVALAGVV